ncbi:MAG: hypothetical protein ACXVNF_09540 [Neobacillus sp.]
MKRYCVEKLRSYDPKSKSETWIQTSRSSDNLQMLIDYYLKDETRIIDTVTRKEVARGKINIEDWS